MRSSRILMRGRQHAVLGVCALAVTATLMTPAEAIASAPAKTTTVSTPILTWLSAEQYESKTSRLATDAPISVLPPAYRMKWSDGAVTAESNVRSPNRADPPGTGASWQVIEYDFHDLAGRNLPVRIGNGDLGCYHYAHAYNLNSFQPSTPRFRRTRRPTRVAPLGVSRGSDADSVGPNLCSCVERRAELDRHR